MTDLSKLPQPGTVYQHHSGRRYVVQVVTNIASREDTDPVRRAKFPLMVTYYLVGQELAPWEWFTHPLVDFEQSFTLA
jgi:hypothetical protein